MNLIKNVILVSLFFSLAVTIYARVLPAGAQNYVTGFSATAQEINFSGVGGQVEDSLRSQTNIPVIEIGALVFYSGNIFIDLLANFAFAVPEMIGLIVGGFVRIFALNYFLVAQVQIFFSVLFLSLYFVGLIETLMQIRSGGRVV